MRIGFAGSTSVFSINILLNLIKNKNIPYVVYLKTDKKKGRGLNKNYSDIKKISLFFGIKIIQVEKINKFHLYNIFINLNLDIFIISGYGKIIPEYYFSFVSYGFFNLHPSLLPKWRGASPIKRALVSGNTIIGLSLIKLSKLIDQGPIYAQYIYVINNLDSYFNIEKKLSFIGSFIITSFIKNICFLREFYIYQNKNISLPYAHKIKKEEKYLKWDIDKNKLIVKIKTFCNWPGIFTRIKNIFIKIWEVESYRKKVNNAFNFKPGHIIKIFREGIVVKCSNGFIIIKKFQFPGKNIISVKDYINNNKKIIKNNMIFY